jgi:hypothetical protein
MNSKFINVVNSWFDGNDGGHRISVDTLLNNMKNGINTYEFLCDDRPYKCYFDVDDYVDSHLLTNNFIKEKTDLCCNGIVEFFKTILNKNKKPIIYYASSHCYDNYEGKKGKAKLSLRFYINNYIMHLSTNKNIAKYLKDNVYQGFDTMPYNKNQKIRCVGCSKPGQNRPIIMELGDLENSIIQEGEDEDAEFIESFGKSTEKTYDNNNDNIEVKNDLENDKYFDLLFNVIKNESKEIINYEKWFQIAGILKHNKYDFKVFLKFCVLLNQNHDSNWKKIWDGINIDTPMSIYGLQTIAKEVNYDGYKAWLIKNNSFISMDILNKGENDVAIFIKDYLNSTLIFCRERWFQYNNKLFIWEIVKEPSAKIITAIQVKINEALECTTNIMNKLDPENDKYKVLEKQTKEYFKHYQKATNGSFINQVKKCLQEYLKNNQFVNILDNGLYKMYYKNGVLDLKTLIFRKGLKCNDYITKYIDFDYEEPSNDDVLIVLGHLKKICNYNDEHLHFYLCALGYAMTGDASKEQHFMYLLGVTARNGKSVIYECLESLMPNYVIKGTSTMLDKGAKIDKDCATWNGAKLLWINELSTKIKDEGLLKAVCDGTSYKYNKLYSTTAEVQDITFKIHMVSNNSLKICCDEGLKRRFFVMEMTSQFKDVEDDKDFEDDYEKLLFREDKTLRDKLLGDLKHALLYLIYSYSKKYFEDKKMVQYPKEWKKETEQIIKLNDKFMEWFEETFEFGEGFYVYGKDMEELWKTSPLKDQSIRDEFKRYKLYTYDCDHVKTIAKIRKKGFWLGFREKINCL